MGLNNENVTEAMLLRRPWLAFDIETAPMHGCGEYITDPIEAPSNYKDPVKIAAYVEEKRQKQIADAGLDLDLCEIVAIGTGGSTGPVTCCRAEPVDERYLLDWFWHQVEAVTSLQGVLVGFNCLHFDLPILLRRSLYLGVRAQKVNIDKYRHDGVIDLQHELSYGGKMTWRSLAFYAKRFGIPHDDSVKGEQIAGLVSTGQWEQVAAHVRADVATTAALAQRLGLVRAEQPESVVA